MISAPFPKIYRGETFVIVGAGPSLTREQCWRARELGHRIMVVNRAFEYAPFASVMYGADPRMWDHYWDNLPDIPIRITCNRELALRRDMWWINGTDHDKQGVNVNAALVNYGLHSGFQSIGVAYHLGAAEIKLIGFDCKHSDDGRAHFHADHDGDGMSNACNPQQWAERFEEIAEQDLLPITNCTIDSALTAFPRGEL